MSTNALGMVRPHLNFASWPVGWSACHNPGELMMRPVRQAPRLTPGVRERVVIRRQGTAFFAAGQVAAAVITAGEQRNLTEQCVGHTVHANGEVYHQHPGETDEEFMARMSALGFGFSSSREDE